VLNSVKVGCDSHQVKFNLHYGHVFEKCAMIGHCRSRGKQ